jgi:gliding motility-associated-like protein
VVVTDSHACSQSSQIIVTTPTQFASAISSTNVVCYGQANGTAEVSTLGGTPPYNYLWSPGGATSRTVSNLAPGIYTATITDSAGCRSVMSDTISQPQQLVLNATGSTTLCYGQSATLTASVSGGTLPYQFTWSNGFTGASQSVSPLTLTNYSVHITDAHGCATTTMSLPVAVHPPLNVSASATDSICEGSSATIASVASGGNGGPYSYSWNGGALTGSSAQVAPIHDTTFTVSVSDGCSAPVQAAVNVRVNPVPVPQFLPQRFSGCAPLTVTLGNGSQATAGSVYQWTFGDGTVTNVQSPVHVYPNPGQYSVSLTIRTLEGCSAQLSVANAVNVFAVPKANFTMSDNEVTVMDPLIEFTDLSTHATSWYWDFGDQTGTSHVRNPSYTYQDTGVYVVMLITTNAGGCADTVYRILSVDEDFNVYIPNAFTPNFDGDNDGFMAKGTGITAFEMLIYDRWGMMIYQTNSMEAPWNGKMDNTGQPCIQDVYVYKMRVFDPKNRAHDFIGKVTLVR